MAFQTANLVNDLKYNDNRYLLKGTTAGIQTVTGDIVFEGDITFSGGTSSLYYLKTEFINATLGIVDANKPIKTDASGLISSSFLPFGGATWKLISPDTLLNPVVYTDNFGDTAMIGNLTTAGDLRVDGGQIGLSTDVDLITVSNNLVDVSGRIQASGTAASVVIDASAGNVPVLYLKQNTNDGCEISSSSKYNFKVKTGNFNGSEVRLELTNNFPVASSLYGRAESVIFTNDFQSIELASTATYYSSALNVFQPFISNSNNYLCLRTNFIGKKSYIGVEWLQVSGYYSDYDLMMLEDSKLTINGDLTVKGNIVVDNDKYIGCVADTDLLQITSGVLRLRGYLRLDDSGYIGTASDIDTIQLLTNQVRFNTSYLTVDTNSSIGCAADTDLLAIKNGELEIRGALTVAGTVQISSLTNVSDSSSRFAMFDGSGNIKYRTHDETYNDLGFAKVTGLTISTSLRIPYPDGYTADNCHIISLRIGSIGGAWVDVETAGAVFE